MKRTIALALVCVAMAVGIYTASTSHSQTVTVKAVVSGSPSPEGICPPGTWNDGGYCETNFVQNGGGTGVHGVARM